MAISSCLVRRSHTNFQPERISIAALFEELRQIPHARPKSEGKRTGTRDILTIRRHFFDRYSCIRVQSSSVNRQAWFIFIGPDWRATISESYITYLHFDDKVSTALARSRHKNAPLSTRSRWEGPHQLNLESSSSLAWMQREPGAWWRCSQCAQFPAASFSFEIWRPSWSDQLCRQEKRWISPDIDPLIDESWHRSGYIANCFHKRNWKVLKVKRVGEWFISGKKTLVGSFGRYQFAACENPHSCMH